MPTLPPSEVKQNIAVGMTLGNLGKSLNSLDGTVNVNLPLSLVKAGIKMGARFAPDMEELDWNELVIAIQEGASGKIVEVEDEEDGERVEVYVE